MHRSTMLRRGALALALAAAAAAPGAALSAEPVVGVGQGGDRFTPSSVSVPTGGTVTWRWAEDGHNVHVRSAVEGFDSGYKGPGATYSHTFTHPGTYTFVCDAHQPEMRGTVTVGSARPHARRVDSAHRRHRHRHHRARRAGSGDDDD